MIIQFICSTCSHCQLALGSKTSETLASLTLLFKLYSTHHLSEIFFSIKSIPVPVHAKINGASFAKWKECIKEHTMLAFSHQITWSIIWKRSSRKYRCIYAVQTRKTRRCSWVFAVLSRRDAGSLNRKTPQRTKGWEWKENTKDTNIWSLRRSYEDHCWVSDLQP